MILFIQNEQIKMEVVKGFKKWYIGDNNTVNYEIGFLITRLKSFTYLLHRYWYQPLCITALLTPNRNKKIDRSTITNTNFQNSFTRFMLFRRALNNFAKTFSAAKQNIQRMRT